MEVEFLLAFAEDVKFRVLPVAVEEDPDWSAGGGEDAVLGILCENEPFGFGRDGPGEMVVLPEAEEGGIPVDVERVEVLEDVLKGHPESVGHALFWGFASVGAQGGC